MSSRRSGFPGKLVDPFVLQLHSPFARDRFCIKVPCTGPAMNAAKILNAEGIRTLGTSLFGLPQAIASSQSDCLYISPYFNGTQ